MNGGVYLYDLKGRLLADFGAFLGKCEHMKLKYYSKHANKKQEKLLLHLMRDNRNTLWGRKNNFSQVHSVEDYQKIVPLSRYEDYDEYVRRMANGEKNLITSRYGRRFTESSGSTGRSKLVPLSARAE